MTEYTGCKDEANVLHFFLLKEILTEVTCVKNNLAAIMGDRLVTITDVYKATGIARSTLVRLYYRRAKNISLETLKTLCDYFGISLSDLIEYNPKTKRPI